MKNYTHKVLLTNNNTAHSSCISNVSLKIKVRYCSLATKQLIIPQELKYTKPKRKASNSRSRSKHLTHRGSWKRKTKKRGTNLQDWKKRTDYGQQIKPKQPIHFLTLIEKDYCRWFWFKNVQKGKSKTMELNSFSSCGDRQAKDHENRCRKRALT